MTTTPTPTISNEERAAIRALKSESPDEFGMREVRPYSGLKAIDLLDALEAAEAQVDFLEAHVDLLADVVQPLANLWNDAEARAEKAERERDVYFDALKWLAETIVHRLECGDCPGAFFGDEACQPDRKRDEPCLREGAFCWLDLACRRAQTGRRAKQQAAHFQENGLARNSAGSNSNEYAACVSQVSDKEACASENGKSERQKPCPGCGGKGGLEYEPGLLTQVCRECDGTGKQQEYVDAPSPSYCLNRSELHCERTSCKECKKDYHKQQAAQENGK